MFFTYLKRSLPALLWLLLPVFAMLCCYALFNYNDGPWAPVFDRYFFGKYWDEVEFIWLLISGITAVTVNFLLLIIIPCLFGGMDRNVKRRQFMAGFITNLILGIGFSLFIKFLYNLDFRSLFIVFLLLYLIAFPVTLIAGSRFVTKDYKKAFWF